jgi:hypothetical protein
VHEVVRAIGEKEEAAVVGAMQYKSKTKTNNGNYGTTTTTTPTTTTRRK